MSKTMVDADQLRNLAFQIESKRKELNYLLQKCDALIGYSGKSFAGQRAFALFSEYRRIAAEYDDLSVNLEKLTALLTKMAEDFNNADQ